VLYSAFSADWSSSEGLRKIGDCARGNEFRLEFESVWVKGRLCLGLDLRRRCGLQDTSDRDRVLAHGLGGINGGGGGNNECGDDDHRSKFEGVMVVSCGWLENGGQGGIESRQLLLVTK